MCIVFINRTIWTSFNMKDPLACQDIMMLGWWYQQPCPISNKGIKFIWDSFPPMSMLHNLSDYWWFKVLRKWMFEHVKGPLGVENIILGMSDRGVISLWIEILNLSISNIWSNSGWEKMRSVTWCWSESEWCFLRWWGRLDRCCRCWVWFGY